MYFNPETEEFSTEKQPGFVKLPSQVGIIWADDQSMNQITFRCSKADYVFCPEDDIPLLEQYTDQLADMLRGKKSWNK